MPLARRWRNVSQLSGIDAQMNAANTELTNASEPNSCRALVPIGASQPQACAEPRRAAPFLAHLIATRAQAPQTRVHRRADPTEAIARYRAVAGMVR